VQQTETGILCFNNKSQGSVATHLGVVGFLTIKLLQTTAECMSKKLVNRSTFDLGLENGSRLIDLCTGAVSC